MTWTPYADLDALLHELLGTWRTILGTTLAGAYVQGSFALGAGDQHSDCDWIVAIHERPTLSQESQLRTLHRDLPTRTGHWPHDMEGSYAPIGELASVAYLGSSWLYNDHGQQTLEWDDHCNRAYTRWILREHGIVLTGPAPRSFMPPVPQASLRAEAAAAIPDLINDLGTWLDIDALAWGQRYAVTMTCRILYTLDTAQPSTGPRSGALLRRSGAPGRTRAPSSNATRWTGISRLGEGPLPCLQDDLVRARGLAPSRSVRFVEAPTTGVGAPSKPLSHRATSETGGPLPSEWWETCRLVRVACDARIEPSQGELIPDCLGDLSPGLRVTGISLGGRGLQGRVAVIGVPLQVLLARKGAEGATMHILERAVAGYLTRESGTRAEAQDDGRRCDRKPESLDESSCHQQTPPPSEVGLATGISARTGDRF